MAATTSVRIEAMERRAQVLRWRSRGLSNVQVARKLGISPQRVSQLFNEALQQAPSAEVEEARKVETEHLMELRRKAMDVLRRQHIVIQNGRIVGKYVGVERLEDGSVVLDHNDKPIPMYEPILDDQPVLQAIDRLLRISERLAKLHGWDKPVKIEITDEDGLNSDIEQGIDELIASIRDTTPSGAQAKAEVR